MRRISEQAELELADFIRRTEESLDEHAQVQLAAALTYIRGRTEPVTLDKESIRWYDTCVRTSFERS